MPLPRPQRIRLSCRLVGRAVLEHPPVGLFSVMGTETGPWVGPVSEHDTSRPGSHTAPGPGAEPACRSQSSLGNLIPPRCEVSVSLLSASTSCFWVSLAQEAGTRENFPLCQSQDLFWGRGEPFGAGPGLLLGV